MLPTLDRAALLAWLRSHAEHPDVLVYAVLTGLHGRIERGEFDENEDLNQDGPGGVGAPFRDLTPDKEGL